MAREIGIMGPVASPLGPERLLQKRKRPPEESTLLRGRPGPNPPEAIDGA